jgi:phosphoribosyl 1,2-cyclic phosphodiesterase
MSLLNLKVLSSGSVGNCYILKARDKILLLEAGVSIKKIKEGLNFRLKEVIGCLVSHEHL